MGLFTSFQLKSRDADTRRRAALSLGVAGKTSAFTALQPLLQDPEPSVRQAALEALGRIQDAAAVPLIIGAVRDTDALKDPDRVSTIRAAAVEALGRIGAPAVAPLLETLRDKHVRLRETVIAALGGIGGDQAVLGLAPALDDDRSSVRQAAATALARAGGAAAIPPLRRALGHKDPTTRRAAAEALGLMREAGAVEALRTAIGDRERTVRDAAVQALATIGTSEAVDTLVAGLQAGDRETKAAVGAALKGFDWQPSNAAQRIVHAVLHGRFDEAAAEGPAAVDALSAALADRDPAARRGAAAALGQVADPRAAAALVALFRDPDGGARDAAIEAVAAIGLPSADVLVEALRDRTTTVRAAAGAVLARLGEGRVAGHFAARLAAGAPAQHGGRGLHIVTTRDELDAARRAADNLALVLEGAGPKLPPDVLQRCAAVTDVILVEPGEVPSSSDAVDAEPLRQAAAQALRKQ